MPCSYECPNNAKRFCGKRSAQGEDVNREKYAKDNEDKAHETPNADIGLLGLARISAICVK